MSSDVLYTPLLGDDDGDEDELLLISKFFDSQTFTENGSNDER